MACTIVRLLFLQESTEHKNCTISLDWAVAIETALPVVRDARSCFKRVVVAFRLTVDVLFARYVVNWVFRVPRVASSTDRADPSALIVWHKLDVAHRWQK